MMMRTFGRGIAAMLVTGAVATGLLLPAAAAQAAPAPQPPAASLVSNAAVDIVSGAADIVARLIKIIDDEIRKNVGREAYVKSLMEGSFNYYDRHYNVMIINNDNRIEQHLNGVVFEGVAKGVHGEYRIFVFESGTFRNFDDGSYKNWAFKGWFDRDGMFVTFHRG
jgi:hypothetical protein